MAITTYLSIITSNINGLNAPIERHRVAESIRNQDPYISCLQETHSAWKTHIGLKRWKKLLHENGNKTKKLG